jgi:hypothetical protein
MSFENFKLFKKNKLNNTNNEIIINDKFIFIQIPKTSSTVVYNMCAKYNLTKCIECYRHEGLLYIENFIKKEVPVYAIVRNPYSHIYSYFFHKINKNELILDNKLNVVQNFEIFVMNNVNDVHLCQCSYIRSNKGIIVKTFKYEDKNFYDYLCNTYNLINENKIVNENKLSIYKKENIKNFFINKDIVNLIIKNRKEEFEMFNYSTDINDIVII